MPLSKEQQAELDAINAELETFSEPDELSRINQELAEIEAKEKQEGEVGAIEAGARSLAEGLTFGFSEEIAGLVASPFLSDEEEKQFEREQEAQRLAGERKFGALTTGAELVGNIISGTSVALAGAAALPVTTAVGATAATLGGGTALGLTVGAGKSRAEFGSDRWNEDVALGALVGFATAPLGVAAGKVLKSAAQSELAAGAGHMVRKYSDKWFKAGATGDLGPGAQAAARETAAEAVEFQTKRAAEKGTGIYGTKTLDDISEDVLVETRNSIHRDLPDSISFPKGQLRSATEIFAAPKRLKTSSEIAAAKTAGLDAAEETLEEITESIPGIGSLDINPAVASAQNEIKIKALKAATRSGTKAQRAQAMKALDLIKAEEREFLRQVSDDLPGAMRGDFGDKAKAFAEREVAKQIKRMEADEKAAEAVLIKIFNKGSKKVQDKTDKSLKKDFQKFLDNLTFTQAARAGLQGRPFTAGIRAAGATFRAGVTSPGAPAAQVGTSGAAPAVAASAFASPGVK